MLGVRKLPKQPAVYTGLEFFVEGVHPGWEVGTGKNVGPASV